eukprot:gnl/Ergobibamus_cyprinoides/2853.p3 GENE.gnl/Ergobibamus_cyprinoides/2853~~gnl/Ergobibamus_cyprinoides/2853.p3  ORF type:complete len:136 (+),score=55.67 gnl/Ergobibamus_cyprinoides/2853:189-596(+)
MVRDAERFADEDKAVRERAEARNAYESAVYGLRSSLGDKAPAEDKATVDKLIADGIAWLEAHPDASKEEYESQLKQFQAVSTPTHHQDVRRRRRPRRAAMPGGMPGRALPGTGFPTAAATPRARAAGTHPLDELD